MAFELAGRQLSQMSAVQEALLGSIIVQAARQSQSPLLLIQDGDRQIRNERFCADLTEQAIGLVERHRVYHEVSYDAFATLVLAAGSSTKRSHLPVSVSRSYRASSLNILRQLPRIDFEQLHGADNQRRMAMTFTAAFLDSLFATRDGLNLSVSDEDLEDWLPKHACDLIFAPIDPSRTRRILAHAPSPLPVAWAALLAMCRTFVRKCSSRASTCPRPH